MLNIKKYSEDLLKAVFLVLKSAKRRVSKHMKNTHTVSCTKTVFHIENSPARKFLVTKIS